MITVEDANTISPQSSQCSVCMQRSQSGLAGLVSRRVVLESQEYKVGQPAKGSYRFIGAIPGVYTFSKGWIIRVVIDPVVDFTEDTQKALYDAAVAMLGQVVDDMKLTYFEVNSNLLIEEVQVMTTRSFDLSDPVCGTMATCAMYQVIPPANYALPLIIAGILALAILFKVR